MSRMLSVISIGATLAVLGTGTFFVWRIQSGSSVSEEPTSREGQEREAWAVALASPAATATVPYDDYAVEFRLSVGDSRHSVTVVNATLRLMHPDGERVSICESKVVDISPNAPTRPELTSSLLALRKGLSTACHFQKDAQGAVVGIGFPVDEARDEYGSLRRIVSALQLQVQPGAERWAVDEPNSEGLCSVQYERVSPTTVTKSVQQCSYLARGKHQLLPATNSSVTLTEKSRLLVEGGRTSEVTSESEVRFGAQDVTVKVSTDIRLRYVGSGSGVNPYPQYRSWTMRPLYGLEQRLKVQKLDPSAPRRLSAPSPAELARLNGRDYAALTRELEQAVKQVDYSKIHDLFRNLGVLFRANPQTMDRAVAHIQSKIPAEVAEPILGAIGAAGGAEGQVKLLQLANDDVLEEPVRAHALDHMALVRDSTELTVAGLSDAVSDLDGPLKGHALTALGGSIRAHSGESEAVDEGIDSLIDASKSGNSEDAINALLGIGNAGSRKTLARLKEALQSPDPEVRATAVYSLRYIAGDDVDELIATALLRDADAAVRESAAAALAPRTLSPTLAQAALLAVQAEPEAMVRRTIIRGLGAPLHDSPTYAIVAWVAQNDPDENVRALALELLGER